ESNIVFALGSVWTDITQRKRDEESLRQTAADLHAAQHVAHVGSFRWDLRTGEIRWSEEMYRIFGLNPAEPRKAPIYIDPDTKALSEEARARVRAAVEKTLADGSPFQLDLAVTRPDGSVVWIDCRSEAVRDETGRVAGMNGTCTDITAIKDLERLRDEWTSVIAHDLRQPIGT